MRSSRSSYATVPSTVFKKSFLIVVADTAQIALPRGGASIYASSPLDLAAIVLLGPSAAVLVEAVASFFSVVVVRRRRAF